MCQRPISAREPDRTSLVPVTEAFSHFNVALCAIRVDITAQHAEGTYWGSLDPMAKGKELNGPESEAEITDDCMMLSLISGVFLRLIPLRRLDTGIIVMV
jgi:hypothetical protein